MRCLRDDQFEAFLTNGSAEQTKYRLISLADRLEISERDFATIQSVAGAGLRQLILDAVHGVIPNGKEDDPHKRKYKSHSRTWFKSVDGGYELEAKLFSLGLWPQVKDLLLPFCNGVRGAVDMLEIDDLPA